MKTNLQFLEAIKFLEEKNISEFSKFLLNLYGNINCNCFFRKIDKSTFLQLEILIEKIEDDISNFDLNLVKGFIYLRNKKLLKAYKYLSNAINLNKKIDLPFSLRAEIGNPDNFNNQDDAKKAVSINPIARNFFVLANSYDHILYEKEMRESLIYFNKAIELDPNFDCAYNNRATKYAELNETKNALNDYKKCIQLNPYHWAYKQIYNILSKDNLHYQALKYAKLGEKYHPNDINYVLAIGLSNMQLNSYEEAIQYFQKYLETKPQDYKIKKFLNKSISELKVLYLKKANKSFESKNYANSLKYFELFLSYCDDYKVNSIFIYDLNDSNFELDLTTYYICLLKCKNKNSNPKKDNEISESLRNLIQGFFDKTDKNKQTSSSERNASKLMIYEFNYTLGFGKYKGEKLYEILDENAHYILWCVINLNHFLLNSELFLLKNLKNEPLYLDALNINMIKERVYYDMIYERDCQTDINNNNSSDFDSNYWKDYAKSAEGDWGGLYGDEAETGYWNTQ